MKKLLYLLPVLIVFFASCGPVLEPPVQIGPGIDTVFYSTCEYEVPVTAPRFDCKGNRLPHPKIVAWKKDTCVTVNHIGFNESYLNNLGYQYVGKPVSVGPVDPPNGPLPNKVSGSGSGDFPWDWIFGLLLALLLGVGIWKLSQWNVNSETSTSSTSMHSSTSDSSSTAKNSNPASAAPPSMNEKAEAVQKILSGMKANDMEGEFELGDGVKGKFTSKKGTKTEGPKGGDKKPAGEQDKRS